MSVDQWVRERLPGPAMHLDVAGCGRISTGVLHAQIAHLQAEAASGGYVAEADHTGIAVGRARLAALVGLGGADVAFTENGGGAFAALLEAWPLPAGARIGTLPSDYRVNAAVLRVLAERRGWTLVPLPTDDLGRITSVPGDLDLVTFPQVASQRGIAQPMEVVLASGVPLVLDVAQSLGQTPVPAGCAAYIGSSRKWLCGPRGVGFAVVDSAWGSRLTTPPTTPEVRYDTARRLESQEANIAGRAGLAVAVQEWTPELIPVVHGLAEQLRTLLADLPGWRVVEPVDEPTGITTLVGGDPVPVWRRLLRQGFVSSAVQTSRAADMDAPALRLSTAAWLTHDDLDRLAAALRSCA